MTPEELAAIEERADAATPGPWYEQPGDSGGWGHAIRPPYGGSPDPVGDVQITADADFIAHAREDVPALVAEVRRLREALEELADNGDRWPHSEGAYLSQMARAALDHREGEG